MIFTETRIPGAYIIDLERREDARGFFSRVWCQKEFESHGLNVAVAQINAALSTRKGCLRGMHYQAAPFQEAKTVRCTMGAIFDVIVDLRPNSPTYKRWIGAELTAQNRRSLYLPEGCAHGYQTLADDTEMYYQTSQIFVPPAARGVRYNDPAFGIVWPMAAGDISEADRLWSDYTD